MTILDRMRKILIGYNFPKNDINQIVNIAKNDPNNSEIPWESSGDLYDKDYLESLLHTASDEYLNI